MISDVSPKVYCTKQHITTQQRPWWPSARTAFQPPRRTVSNGHFPSVYILKVQEEMKSKGGATQTDNCAQKAGLTFETTDTNTFTLGFQDSPQTQAAVGY